MWLWICKSFVVKKAQVETNVFSFKVNSEGGRVSYGSVICDYAAWLGFSLWNMYALQSGPTALWSEGSFLRGRADYVAAVAALFRTELLITFR